MLDNIDPIEKEHIKKNRKLFKDTIYKAIYDSKNPNDLAQNFQKLLTKITILTKYSTRREIWKTNTNTEIQTVIFTEIINRINRINKSENFSKIFNTIPKTVIREYATKSFWEQFSQIHYLRKRKINETPEGWNCRYYTILLHNFFSQLKEAWLDLNIKIFRNKDNEDEDAKHSWLVITFQWVEYLIDWDNKEPIVRKVQELIEKYSLSGEIYRKYYENLKHEKMNETDQIKFFDNTEQFIEDLEQHSASNRMTFHRRNKKKVERISVHFIEWEKHRLWKNITGISIKINEKEYTYLLVNTWTKKTWFPLNLVEQIYELKDYEAKKLTSESKKLLKSLLPYIFSRINYKKLNIVENSNNKPTTDTK